MRTARPADVGPVGPQTRYRLLETIRVFARDRLAAHGEARAVRDRHLEHFRGVAADAAVGLRASEADAHLAVLDLDVDNLRAAMDWALASASTPV